MISQVIHTWCASTHVDFSSGSGSLSDLIRGGKKQRSQLRQQSKDGHSKNQHYHHHHKLRENIDNPWLAIKKKRRKKRCKGGLSSKGQEGRGTLPLLLPLTQRSLSSFNSTFFKAKLDRETVF